MRIALDTNILAYAEGVNGAAAKRAALELIRKLPDTQTFLPCKCSANSFVCLSEKPDTLPRRRGMQSSDGKIHFL